MNNRNISQKIHLTDEEKKRIMEEIRYYFETEREEKIGIIAAESLLEFFMDNLGTIIYNKALDDVKLWYSRRMDDVEADFYTLYKSNV
jgi:uncharacterized protein (DUF2164 family)